MIITRTPLRIPIGGGGSDLPAFYQNHGGFFISASLNRYVYVAVNPRFERSFRISYSRTELCNDVEEIEHPIVREALRMLRIGPGLEIVSLADLPANSGMGSSGTFTVGLLQALHAHKGEYPTAQALAEEAFELEGVRLREPVGKQDQYIAAYGGIRAFSVSREGVVEEEQLNLSAETIATLHANLVLFHTGIGRRASDVLADQQQRIGSSRSAEETAMMRIMEIGHEIRTALEAGDCEAFGRLMDEHWQRKRETSNQIASGDIDRWYRIAIDNGAIGGKLMGAGGGGFFLFYCRPELQARVANALAAVGLSRHPFSLAPHGATIVMNETGATE